MNYYEHHIGDYDEATAHLSACEDGIYSRLIRKYYATEKPLIADVAKLQRLVRAKTKDEKQAVIDVLEEFFSLQDDGYHQKTCDHVLEKFLVGEPEREVKKANENNRMARHRAERAALFKTITDAGEHMPWNAPTQDLRDKVVAVTGKPSLDTPATVTVTQPVTASATPATATQTPDTNHQTPDPKDVLLPPSAAKTPPAAPEKKADTELPGFEKPDPRGVRLPDDWVLPTVWRQWCADNRPDLDPEKTADGFRDFWVAKPGKDGRKADWLATWRNWCRNQKTGNGPAPDSSRGSFV